MESKKKKIGDPIYKNWSHLMERQADEKKLNENIPVQISERVALTLKR